MHAGCTGTIQPCGAASSAVGTVRKHLPGCSVFSVLLNRVSGPAAMSNSMTNPASWHFPGEDAEKSEQEQELRSTAAIKPLHPRYPNYLWSKAEGRMACQSQLLLTVPNRGLGISWTHRQIPLTIGLLSGTCQYGLEKNSSPGYLDLRYVHILALL